MKLGSGKIKRYLAIFICILIFSMGFASASTVAHSGMNSCSKGWYHTGGTFENYCPFCHHSECLLWNPKGTPEGEWTCAVCDSDFCVCGRCKATGSSVYLIPATKKPVPAPVTVAPVSVNVPSQWDILKLHIQQEINKNMLINA